MSKPVNKSSPEHPRNADQRRQVLRLILAERGMTPAELARLAGFKRPDIIHAFLNGRTSHFRLDTLARLSRALGVSTDVLLGLDPAEMSTSADQPTHLPVRASVGVGEWRHAFDLPLSQQFAGPVRVDRDLRAKGAFSVLVQGRGAEKIYREGSILVVLPLDQWDGILLPGHRVVLQRIQDLVEVTVREIEVSDGRAWLGEDRRMLPTPRPSCPWKCPGPRPGRCGSVVKIGS